MSGNSEDKVLKGSENPAREEASSAGRKSLNEAYVGTPQNYALPTEQLTQRTKKTHQAIYEQSVETMNSISLRLEGADRHDANSRSSVYRTLKRDESSAINAAFLHALFFDNISDVRSQITTDMVSYVKLARDWGTFDRWQEDFRAACLSSRNGWCVTVYNTFLNRYLNVVVDEEADGVPFGCVPIIVMDMHEHAFFHDYLANKELYVTAMMLEFDWEVINARFERAERIANIVNPKGNGLGR